MTGDRLEPAYHRLQQRLVEAVDKAYALKISRLVPTGWEVRGIPVPRLRAIARELRREPDLALSRQGVDLLDRAFAGHNREEALVLIFAIAAEKKQLTPALWPPIDRWIDEIADWEICDQLAMGIAAPIVAEKLDLVEVLVLWSESTNEWRRRFALATAAALNQKGRAHVAETLRICAAVMADSSPTVRKAAGWALREAGEHDPEALAAFLVQHRAAAHRTILREGSAKLDPAVRASILSE